MYAHIIGAGVAGLSAANSTAKLGYKPVIWEKENLPCVYASSRNAAIFRTYEADPVISYLVKRNYLSILELENRGFHFLNRTGLLLDPLEVDYYEQSFLKKHPQASQITGERKTMELPDGQKIDGILISANGVLDVHHLQEYLIRSLLKTNGRIEYNKEICAFKKSGGKISAIEFTDNTTAELSEKDIVVNAAGSWSAKLMETCGIQAPPLVPHKRHLYYLKSKDKAPGLPVIWNEKKDIYFRPESSGFLATHCDQRPAEPDDYGSDEKETHRFLTALTGSYSYFKDFHISKYWACLRTFTLDNLPVIGFDANYHNLLWFTGFGGKGMSLAFSAGEFLVEKVTDNTINDDIKNPLSPLRFA